MQLSEAERSVGYPVKRVQQGLRRRCDTALKPTGLSMAQYTTLRALAEHPEASAAELARLCFVTRQSLQDMLVGLRTAGLVETADAPPRGRSRSLALTAWARGGSALPTRPCSPPKRRCCRVFRRANSEASPTSWLSAPRT